MLYCTSFSSHRNHSAEYIQSIELLTGIVSLSVITECNHHTLRQWLTSFSSTASVSTCRPDKLNLKALGLHLTKQQQQRLWLAYVCCITCFLLVSVSYSSSAQITLGCNMRLHLLKTFSWIFMNFHTHRNRPFPHTTSLHSSSATPWASVDSGYPVAK